ncbi:M24 family metallopeptidase [Leptothoe sp. EHU-05/26/07-4]
MHTLEQQVLERTQANFSEDLFFASRDRSFEAVRRISRQIQVGMLEEEANEIAIATLQDMGARQNWHQPCVRFGPNTIKTIGADSVSGIRLGENDIYFIDVGPVWGNYEGAAGDTFVTGENLILRRCADDVKHIFQAVSDKWKIDALGGDSLYKFAQDIAHQMGWVLNMDLSGHRLGDFPHDVYYKGGLADISFCPSSKLWVLEIQIRHPHRAFGAFYEDLLI